MKRENNLFHKIVDINNIINAHRDARKNKSTYPDVKMVNENELYYAKIIRDMLINNKWKPCMPIISVRYENGKKRETVDVDYFPDRIIHHAIMRIIEPIFEKVYIKDTYQSIKNRGLHKGASRVKSWIRGNPEDTKY